MVCLQAKFQWKFDLNLLNLGRLFHYDPLDGSSDLSMWSYELSFCRPNAKKSENITW